MANGVKNKTFFKWPIESMYKECEKEQVNEVIKYVFGENDGNVTSSFEKLKYESGRRVGLLLTNFSKMRGKTMN